MNQEDEVSVGQLREISVGCDWKRLACNLEIGDEVIDNINLNKDCNTYEEKCWRVFQEYLRKEGKIKRKFLNSIFEDIGKDSLKIES